MNKLEQISAILDQVFALDMSPMTAINHIAQVLDEPEEVAHG